MSKKTSSIPKVTRPKLERVLPRERLLAALAEGGDKSVVWVHGPPGSGKTTLAATYADRSSIPVVWYQVDGADSDPAILFSYLALACAQLSQKKRPVLPLYTMENAADVGSFAHRFFRVLLQRLPQPVRIVLDDFHNVVDERSFAALIRILVEELPHGSQLMITSRKAPGVEFARLHTTGRMLVLGGDALRLTDDEARAIARQAGHEEAIPKEWLVSIEGWAAGLTLLLSRAGPGAVPPPAIARERVFDYFAGEVLHAMPPGRQRSLMVLALLPVMSVRTARQLAEDDSVGKLLEELHVRHYFIYRQDGAQVSYRFHALFRTFLLEAARKHFSAAEWSRLVERAAHLLVADAQPEQAVALYREVGNWPEVRRLVLESAGDMMARGRWQTLLEWLDALPQGQTEGDPWLTHWCGVAQAVTNAPAGRQRLEEAFEGFVREGDRTGQLLSAAAIVESYQYAGQSYLPLSRWIAELQRLMSPMPRLDRSSELRIWSLIVYALHVRDPDHPLMETAVERVDNLLLLDIEADQRISAATFLLEYCSSKGSYEKSAQLIRLVGDLLEDPDVSDSTAMRWWRQQGYFLHTQGRHKEANAALGRAREAAQRGGLSTSDLDRHLYNYELVAALGNRDQSRAIDLIRQVEPLIGPEQYIGTSYFNSQKARLAMLQEDYASAARIQEFALDQARKAGLAEMELALFLTVLAICRIECGEYDSAAALLDEAESKTDRGRYALAAYRIDVTRFYLSLKLGSPDEELQRNMLARGAAKGFHNVFRWLPGMMGQVFAQALAHDVEPDFTRRCIAVCGFTPPDPSSETWPWPLKIHALGPFSIHYEGVEIGVGGKAQKKPLELLKALIAFGGQGVEPGPLTDALWPEKDASKNLFDNTLHRLRKLLRIEDALLMQDGKLALNPCRVWVDAEIFERLVDEKTPGTPAEHEHHAARVLALYRGEFLAGEPASAWMLPLRARLHSKFMRHIAERGEALEREGRWQRAIQLYHRCIEQDPLAETFYRHLMRCHLQLGDPAEALGVYRRCREMLSIVLGVKPAPETDALYQQAFARSR